MKKNEQKISAGEAMNALEEHLRAEMLWKMKAITLLQMVGMDGADQAKLAKECNEHAERGLAA